MSLVFFFRKPFICYDKKTYNYKLEEAFVGRHLRQAHTTPPPAGSPPADHLPLQPVAGYELTNEHTKERTNRRTNKQTNTTDRNTSWWK